MATRAQRDKYIQKLNNGTFNDDNMRCLKLIQIEPQTNSKLKILLNKTDKNQISGRTCELLDMGFIKIIGKKGGESLFGYISDEKEQVEAMNERREKKLVEWIKRGKKHGFFDSEELKEYLAA